METQDKRQPERDTVSEFTKPSNSPARIDQTAGRAPSTREPHRSASTESFHIVQSTDEGRRVIAPCGELDLSTTPHLEKRLRGNVDTILDLSKLSFIDSTGIHLLLATTRGAQREGWEFTIRDPQPPVLRVIRLVGLDRYLGLEGQIERPPTEPRAPGWASG
jgi:anti-anti-sigma factor